MLKLFIENKKFTYVLTAFFATLGIMGLYSLQSESFPTVNFGTVVITTYYDGASASDIETLITKPIEDEIRKVQGIKEVRSVSQSGLSQITTLVDIDNYDVDEVISDLQRSVDRVRDLPSDLKERPTFFEIKSDEIPVWDLAITGPNENRERDIIAERLEESFEDLRNVSEATLTGATERRFNVLVDVEKLKSYYISLDQLSAAISTRNLDIPGGFVENDENQRLLRIEGKIENAKELEEIVVRANFSGRIIRVKDVAKVVDGKDDPQILARYKGEPATLVTITKKSGSDMIKLRDELKSKLEVFKKPYGDQYQFHIYNDEANRVSSRVSVLSSNALIGLLLVIFFLMIFLPGRSGIMATLSMPLAVLATIGYINFSGMTLNTMTIIALIISLGMLVDNSVVIAENYNRLKNEGYNGFDAALQSVQKLWLPITMTAMTTIAAFLPMLVTTGVMGQFIRYIPLVVTAALIISLLEGFLLLPARLVGSNKQKRILKDGDYFTRKVQKPFKNFMAVLLRWRWLTFFGLTGLLMASFVVMIMFNKFNLFPTTQTEVYIGRVLLSASSDLKATDKELGKLAAAVKEELGDLATHIVAKAGNDQVNFNDRKAKIGENVGQVLIFVSEEAKFMPTDDILERLRKIPQPEGVSIQFQANVNGPPAGEPISAIFRSNDDAQLDVVVNKVMENLNKKDGVFNVQVDDTYGDKEVQMNIDYRKASRLGLNVQTVGNTIRTAYSGRRVSSVSLKGNDVDLFVRLEDEQRNDIKKIERLLVASPKGDLVPLRVVAKAVEGEPSLYLKRFDFKRARTVLGDIDERKITVSEANQVVADTYEELRKDYPAVTLTYAGAQKETQDSMISLMKALGLSLVGIFALLVFLFASYIKPFIIMTTIPFGIVGFAVAFAMQGLPVSFMALIGVIGLGGIIVNSGIVLMSFIEDMKKEGKLELMEILASASGMRLRAVMVTALTTVSGLMPTAYGLGGSDQFIEPMAMSMAWGLVSGTILSLIWVPTAYGILEDINRFKSSLFKKGGKKEKVETNEENPFDKEKSEVISA